MDRTLRLAPDSAAAHMVASSSYSDISRDPALARRETEKALALNPKSIWALVASSGYDLTDGNYRQMFEKLSKAREIDPRATGVLTNLIRAQIYLGQLDEALATSEELMALDPTDYAQMQWVVIAHLDKGDTTGAKRVVQELLTRVPATELVSYFAGYQELAFVLGPKERDLLFRMTPAAFDDDRAWWGQALALAAMQQGDTAKARAYADSSLVTAKQQIDANQTDPQLRMLNAVMLGYAGHKAEAARAADRAIADTVGASTTNANYSLQQYVRAQLAAGDTPKTLDALE